MALCLVEALGCFYLWVKRFLFCSFLLFLVEGSSFFHVSSVDLDGSCLCCFVLDRGARKGLTCTMFFRCFEIACKMFLVFFG